MEEIRLHLLFGPLAAAAVLALLYRFFSSNQPKRASATPPAEKPAQTTLKTYTPAEIAALGRFPDYAALTGVPLPDPYLSFNIATARPRPYRPFRWAYHQTMSLSKMEPNWWLELESTYVARLAQRAALYEKYGRKIINRMEDTTGTVALACREVMEMALQFLAARYPMYFSLDVSTMTFENRILKRTFDVGESVDPLMVVFQNVPEDFVVMAKWRKGMDCGDAEGDGEREGKYVFMAGILCSSLFWDMGTKIGKTVGQIHATVPDYPEKMSMSMDRYFTKLTTDKPIQRGSWDISVGEPLFIPAGDPSKVHRERQDPDLKEEDLTLRVDWQTLRRLPLSNAIVFNFKALFTPLSEFADEPGVPALLEKVVREGHRGIIEYKGLWHVEHVALPMLARMRREQEESGVWREEVRTLEESPFYRGWEEKWRRQQGF
ncbi:hypothetical protein TWF696_001716 [Orbilia brochopaga]|uniref:Uncharacterized protein n=1 Tax=Orbilia brochopaga TaxID=3140254 RepID=A0AAV9U5W6_9PEZI